MYSKWKKRTHREVAAPGLASEASTDLSSVPNVKVNRHVRDELKSLDSLKKQRKVKENQKLKNMSKEQRGKVMGLKKKKQKGMEQLQARKKTKAGSRKTTAYLRM